MQAKGNFRVIIITRPDFFDGEAERIADYLRGNMMTLVHIRKPGSNLGHVEKLINDVPQDLRGRLVLHDHFMLAQKFSLYGVHLNSRNPKAPKGWAGTVSRSCHSLDEVREWKQKMDYVSLSPIFDSISKQGYRSAFTRKMISEAVSDGTIDEKVYALGGITFDRLDEVRQMGFGGAMILGDAWK